MAVGKAASRQRERRGQHQRNMHVFPSHAPEFNPHRLNLRAAAIASRRESGRWAINNC
jgi:hypothetical protein